MAVPLASVHLKVKEAGVKPVAIQPKVTISPVPEPHCASGNTVGAVGEPRIEMFYNHHNFASQNLHIRYYRNIQINRIITVFMTELMSFESDKTARCVLRLVSV